VAVNPIPLRIAKLLRNRNANSLPPVRCGPIRRNSRQPNTFPHSCRRIIRAGSNPDLGGASDRDRAAYNRASKG